MGKRSFKKRLRKLHTAYLRVIAKPESPRRQAQLHHEQTRTK